MEHIPLTEEEREIAATYRNQSYDVEMSVSNAFMEILLKYNDLLCNYKRAQIDQEKQLLARFYGSADLPVFEFIDLAFTWQYFVENKPLPEEVELYYTDLTHPVCIGVLNDMNEQMKPWRKKEAADKHIVCENPSGPVEEVLNELVETYKGKVIMVDLWATWCSGCQRAMKEYETIKGDFDPAKVAFVHITDQTSPLELWQKLIPDVTGYHYRLDKPHWEYIWNYFKLQGLGYHFIIDKEGTIRHEFVHVPRHELKTMIEKLL
ncbi:MAG: TlpA family protein disulfide reductase [Tannerellaceae bacterium]|nr:TlpA family protein disulfide reductase [Tannerellaceae bacterium]